MNPNETREQKIYFVLIELMTVVRLEQQGNYDAHIRADEYVQRILDIIDGKRPL